MIFFLQRRRGFTRLTGVDYSDLAVMLATSVSRSEGFGDIQFMVFLLTTYSIIADYVMALVELSFDGLRLIVFVYLDEMNSVS